MRWLLWIWTGGQSDFGALELAHHWHGIDMRVLFQTLVLIAAFATVFVGAALCLRRLHLWRWPAFIAVLLAATAAYAANTKLSSLSAASAVAGTNRVYCVQADGSGGVSCIASQIATYINSLFSGDATVASGGALTIANNAVTNAKAAQGGANTMKGNWTGSTANEADNTMPSCADSGGNHLNYVNGTGVTCGTSSSGGGSGVPVSYVSGNWYTPLGVTATQTGVAQTANTIYCYYASTGATAPTIKALGARVTTGVAATNVQFAVYSVGATTLTLIDSTGSVASATSGTEVNATVVNTTDALSANTLYAWCSNDSGAPTFNSFTTAYGNLGSAIVGSATQSSVDGTANVLGSSIAQTFNTWPSPITRSGMTDVITRLIPLISFQVN